MVGKIKEINNIIDCPKCAGLRTIYDSNELDLVQRSKQCSFCLGRGKIIIKVPKSYPETLGRMYGG